MIRTLPAAQKALAFRRFCSAYSKNRTKARAAKSEQKRGFMRGSGQSQSRQLPAVHFCQCSGLAFDPVSIEQKAGFSLFCYPVHIPDQQPAHTTPARAEAFRPAASRPTFPASITRNTTTICTKIIHFICATFQSKNACISGYCVVQYRQ